MFKKKLSEKKFIKSSLNFFYICLISYNTLLLVFSFICCLVSAIVLNNYAILYGMLIHIPFIFLGTICTIVFNHLIFNLAKAKKQKINGIISILLGISKYLIVILGLVIGVIVNLTTNRDIFNYISLSVCVFIYPISNIAAVIHYQVVSTKK